MSCNDTINLALIKKLLLLENPNQRITNGAVDAAGELIRIFITEARYRASIEVSLLKNLTFLIDSASSGIGGHYNIILIDNLTVNFLLF